MLRERYQEEKTLWSSHAQPGPLPLCNSGRIRPFRKRKNAIVLRPESLHTFFIFYCVSLAYMI